MSEPRIIFNKPALIGKEQTYVSEVMQSGKTSGDGPLSKQCQNFMREKFGAQHVLTTTSCTSALEIVALLANIEPGDEVIMPSYTFVSTANAFALRGAKIVFADIRPDTLNLDEKLLEDFVTDRTRIIVPVHYAGVACEMDAINEIAEKADALVIEDAAQGVGAKYKGSYLGTIGDFGTFSFHESKNISCGEGGALLTNNITYRDRAEIIREKGTNRSQFMRGQVDKYTWLELGSSYILSDILSAYLYAQLENMELITQARCKAFEHYNLLLQPLADRGLLKLPTIPPHCESNWHIFYIIVKDLATRSNLIKHLKNDRIQALFHYVPLHTSPAGQKMGLHKEKLPVTENLSERLLRLPMYFELKEKEIARVVTSIKTFFSV